jgi:hypothetical protein
MLSSSATKADGRNHCSSSSMGAPAGGSPPADPPADPPAVPKCGAASGCEPLGALSSAPLRAREPSALAERSPRRSAMTLACRCLDAAPRAAAVAPSLSATRHSENASTDSAGMATGQRAACWSSQTAGSVPSARGAGLQPRPCVGQDASSVSRLSWNRPAFSPSSLREAFCNDADIVSAGGQVQYQADWTGLRRHVWEWRTQHRTVNINPQDKAGQQLDFLQPAAHLERASAVRRRFIQARQPHGLAHHVHQLHPQLLPAAKQVLLQTCQAPRRAAHAPQPQLRSVCERVSGVEPVLALQERLERSERLAHL